MNGVRNAFCTFLHIFMYANEKRSMGLLFGRPHVYLYVRSLRPSNRFEYNLERWYPGARGPRTFILTPRHLFIACLQAPLLLSLQIYDSDFCLCLPITFPATKTGDNSEGNFCGPKSSIFRGCPQKRMMHASFLVRAPFIPSACMQKCMETKTHLIPWHITLYVRWTELGLFAGKKRYSKALGIDIFVKQLENLARFSEIKFFKYNCFSWWNLWHNK